MAFQFLDEEAEKLLLSLLKKESVNGENASGTAIEYLVNQGYVNGIDC